MMALLPKKATLVTAELIMKRILLIRGVKVMVDSDLAKLYGTTTKRLNEQVKRNIKRFPEDFMFQLTGKEKQEVVANCDHLRRLKFSSTRPYVFTEHGVVMLASILNSDSAIAVNLHIVRVFIRMRQLLETPTEILLKLDQLQRKEMEQDQQILLIFEYLKQLEQSKQDEADFRERNRIGFRRSHES